MTWQSYPPVVWYHLHLNHCTPDCPDKGQLIFRRPQNFTCIYLTIGRVRNRAVFCIKTVRQTEKYIHTYMYINAVYTIPGGPEITEQSKESIFRTLLIIKLFSSPCWKEHLFPIIITSRSSNLVENFLFYETFIMDCHYRDLPDFQSFET